MVEYYVYIWVVGDLINEFISCFVSEEKNLMYVFIVL